MLELLNNCIGLSESLKMEAEKPYMLALEQFLKGEHAKGKIIFPPEEQIFSAFNYCAYSDYKVVIIGQDPYHGAGQANGLAFSVKKGQKIPPSLRNIYKELHSDVGIPIPVHGDLRAWAQQGVLLVNVVLTVEEGLPGAHQKQGWELFTDRLIQQLSEDLSGLVFLLWGNFAKTKKGLINLEKHLVLEANHPSPLSANRGFFHCKHFSKANSYLVQQQKKPIEWRLSD